jgi:hypothetical protein
MPWYRMKAQYGPGHQSGDFRYFWSGHRLSHEEKQGVFENAYREHDWPIGCVRMVKALPKRVIERKIQHCEDGIKGAQQMLRILGRTPVRKTPDEEESKRHRGDIKFQKLMREAEKRREGGTGE